MEAELGNRCSACVCVCGELSQSVLSLLAVVVVVDASDKRARGQLDRALVRTLSQNRHVPSVLLLNKV